MEDFETLVEMIRADRDIQASLKDSAARGLGREDTIDEALEAVCAEDDRYEDYEMTTLWDAVSEVLATK